MLLAECAAGGVTRWQPCTVQAVTHGEGGAFRIDTDRGAAQAPALVVATGGLSIPQIGASDFGYRLARQFGHRIVPTAPRAGAADLRRGAMGAVRRARRRLAGGALRTGDGQGRARSSSRTCCSPTAA